MFVAPLVEIVPLEAASTALVVVGFLMMTAVRSIDWTDHEIAIPAFLTIVLMSFTYSISNGIGAGVISLVVLMLAAERRGRSTRCCTASPPCSFSTSCAVHWRAPSSDIDRDTVTMVIIPGC